MLSRVTFNTALAQQSRSLGGVRFAQSGTSPPTATCPPPTATCPPPTGTNQTTATQVSGEQSSERDLVNFPRPVRPELPAKVRHGFIPEGWFQMFYKRTGVTGPYALGVGLTTYLFSKEIYVMEHEFYTGISLAIMAVVAVKKLGPVVAAYADKQIDKVEEDWKESRESTVRSLETGIAGEKKEQWRAEGQSILFQAKRDNVALQLEGAYRERISKAFKEVKRRLDYQVERQNIDRRIGQKHMAAWIVENVLKSITPQQEKESLQKCIADLQVLSKA